MRSVVFLATVALAPTLAWGQAEQRPVVSGMMRATANRACLLGVIGGYEPGSSSLHCKLSDILPTAQGYAGYPAADTAPLFVENRDPGPAVVLIDPRFTATQIVPRTPLTAAEMAKLRPGDWVFTNTDPEYISSIARIAPDGSVIDIAGGWGRPGHGEAGQSPAGAPVDARHLHFGSVGDRPAALLNVASQPEGGNTVMEMADVAGGADAATGHEFDFLANSFASPVATQDLLLGSGTVFLAGAAARIVGRWRFGVDAHSGEEAFFLCNPADAVRRTPANPNVTEPAPQGGGCFVSYAQPGRDGVNDFLRLQPGGASAEALFRVDGRGDVSTHGSLTAAGVAARSVVASVTAVLPMHTPASSHEACVPGQTAFDRAFHYDCVEANHWRRAGLEDF